MAEKRFTGSPFGCQSARFEVLSCHPDHKKPGLYTQIPYCRRGTSELVRRLGPGSYESAPGDFSPSVLQRKASGPGWKRAEETKRLAELPHLFYKETWERNRILKESMGPGRYNVKSFLEHMQEKPSSIRGVCATKEVRFKEDWKNCYPGPGTYGKHGNPYTLLDERAAKSASIKGIMETDTVIRKPLQNIGSGLAPGTYTLKSHVDETLTHMVGKRGPYDLFSGPRDKPLCYGHFGSQKKNESEPGAYKLKSFIEDLESQQRKKHGTFGKIAQYPRVPTERICCSSLIHCPRPPNDPAPGFYDIQPSITPKRQSTVPFSSSAKRFDRKACRLLFGTTNPVGVGRYDITKQIRGKTAPCHRSSFVSKTERFLPNPEKEVVLEATPQENT
ncbi:ciliary microtubule-associated protein 2 [Pelodytes ibericus]